MTNSGWPLRPTVRAAVRYEKGVSLLWSAKLGPAASELAEAARIGRQSGVPGWPERALGQLAWSRWCAAGSSTRAVEAAEEAEMLADSLAIPEVSRSAAAAVALACVRSEECDPAARTYADRATARETLAGDAVAATILALVRIRLVRARGNLGDALAIVEHVCRRTDASHPDVAHVAAVGRVGGVRGSPWPGRRTAEARRGPRARRICLALRSPRPLGSWPEADRTWLVAPSRPYLITTNSRSTSE